VSGIRVVQQFFFAAAATLALGDIGTAAQRRAISTAAAQNSVIVFGVLGTLLLAAGAFGCRFE